MSDLKLPLKEKIAVKFAAKFFNIKHFAKIFG